MGAGRPSEGSVLDPFRDEWQDAHIGAVGEEMNDHWGWDAGVGPVPTLGVARRRE